MDKGKVGIRIEDNSVAMVTTSRQGTSETLKKGRPVGSGLPWKIDVLEFFFSSFFFLCPFPPHLHPGRHEVEWPAAAAALDRRNAAAVQQ